MNLSEFIQGLSSLFSSTPFSLSSREFLASDSDTLDENGFVQVDFDTFYSSPFVYPSLLKTHL